MATTSYGDAALADLPRLTMPRPHWSRWLSQGLSLALLGMVLFQLFHTDPAQLRSALPHTPWFIPVLLALYLTLPVADWIIFRRLWGLPFSGFPVLLGKRIGNELLMMYSGEVYFYLWARRHANLSTAPFGTIKDVNILSALSGNVLALVLLVLVSPLVTSLDMGRYARAAVGSASLMLAGSMLVLLLSRRLFTLSRRQLAWVFSIHLARLMAGVLLCALLWHLALPRAPFSFWLVLSTVRLLIARLPLVPNKDLLFAAIAVFLIGNDKEVVALIAMTSTALLLLHLVFGGILGACALVMGERVTPARDAS